MTTKQIVVGVLWSGLARTSLAQCDCRDNEDRLCADAIFVGEIVDADPGAESGHVVNAGVAQQGGEAPVSFRRFNFRVLRSLRGVEGETVGVVSEESSCALTGSVGEKLLVYASREPSTGFLVTRQCWVSRYSDPPLDDRPERELEAWRTLGLTPRTPAATDDSSAPPFDLTQPRPVPRTSFCGIGLTPLVGAVAGAFLLLRRHPRRPGCTRHV